MRPSDSELPPSPFILAKQRFTYCEALYLIETCDCGSGEPANLCACSMPPLRFDVERNPDPFRPFPKSCVTDFKIDPLS